MDRLVRFTWLLLFAAGCNLFSGVEEQHDSADSSAADAMLADAADMAIATADIAVGMDGHVADVGSDTDMFVCFPESDPELCERLGATCDALTADDNCGVERAVSCGSCTAPASCGGGGTPNVCACSAQSDVDFCAAAGVLCGNYTGVDDCGLMRTVPCGTCSGVGEQCIDGACVCVPEPVMAFCTAVAAECGTISGTDICGAARTEDCGGCAAPESCMNNACICLSETDATFCARVGVECGVTTGTDNCLVGRTANCGGCPVGEVCSQGQCVGSSGCGDGTCAAGETTANCQQDCGFASLAAGSGHTCALRNDGVVLCWGRNTDGELGNGGFSSPGAPGVVTFSVATTVSAIASGGNPESQMVCAIGNTGTYCWGNGESGQLGTGGGATDRATPQLVSSTPASALSVGGNHACLITASGAAQCWGENQYGRLGVGDENDRSSPTSAIGLGSGTLFVAGGERHMCFANASGVLCAGSNLNGQQGNGMGGSGQYNETATLTLLTGTITGLEAGGDHNCALTPMGGNSQVRCWGLNDDGQVGAGGTGPEPTPVVVATLASPVLLSAGSAHTCALDGGQALRCWGENGSNELGLSGGDRSTPTLVTLPFTPVAVEAGGVHTCAIDTAGAVWCWGANNFRQLGDSMTGNTSIRQVSL